MGSNREKFSAPKISLNIGCINIILAIFTWYFYCLKIEAIIHENLFDSFMPLYGQPRWSKYGYLFPYLIPLIFLWILELLLKYLLWTQIWFGKSIQTYLRLKNMWFDGYIQP